MMNNNKYMVTDNNYMNTGGHCMVSIFTVIRKTDMTTLYMSVDDDANIVLTTIDHINIDVDQLGADIDYDKITIASYDYSDEYLGCYPNDDQVVQLEDNDLIELFVYGRFEHMFSRCSAFDHHTYIEANELPPALYSQVTVHYIQWLDDNGLLLETDGHQIYMADNYIDPKLDAMSKQARDVENFRMWLATCYPQATASDEETNKFFNDNYFTISFAGKRVFIYNCAVAYDGVYHLLRDVLEDLK